MRKVGYIGGYKSSGSKIKEIKKYYNRDIISTLPDYINTPNEEIINNISNILNEVDVIFASSTGVLFLLNSLKNIKDPNKILEIHLISPLLNNDSHVEGFPKDKISSLFKVLEEDFSNNIITLHIPLEDEILNYNNLEEINFYKREGYIKYYPDNHRMSKNFEYIVKNSLRIHI